MAAKAPRLSKMGVPPSDDPAVEYALACSRARLTALQDGYSSRAAEALESWIGYLSGQLSLLPIRFESGTGTS